MVEGFDHEDVRRHDSAEGAPEKDLGELREAIEGYEAKEGSTEFTEGAIAVIAWFTEEEIPDVEAFMRYYDLM